ncbi:hypothetical protein BDZ97DRAFT_2083726 [Flammula alnicola]|nr:hypothetical protein BDZ97DRAFT_2083726 [Flammula alnicola]
MAIAKIIVAKLDKCPLLGLGEITPAVFQEWHHACKRFAKMSGKDPNTEVVSFIGDAMSEPRLQEWYRVNEKRLDKLTLDEYMVELGELVLDRDWAYAARAALLSARQPETLTFRYWQTELENKNALLTASAPTFALSEDALRNHLEANARPALSAALARKAIPASTTYVAWTSQVNIIDLDLRQQQLVVNETLEARFLARRATRVTLLSDARGNPIPLLSRIAPATPGTSATPRVSTTPRTNSAGAMPKLDAAEKALLIEHKGCFRCRTPYADHQSAACTIRRDGATYVPLTQAAALAARPAVVAPVASSSRLPVAAAFVPYDIDADDELDYDDDTDQE